MEVTRAARTAGGTVLAALGLTAAATGIGDTGTKALLEAALATAGAVTGWMLVPAETTSGRRWKLATVGLAGTASVAAAVGALIGYGGYRLGQGVHWPGGEAEFTEAVRWLNRLGATWAGLLAVPLWRTLGPKWIARGRTTLVAPSRATEDEDTGRADVVVGHNRDNGEPIVLLEEDRFMHMAVMGPTGAGKTSRILMPLIVQDLANPRVGVTAIDPKGSWLLGSDQRPGVLQYARQYGRDVYVVDPDNPETDYFNPLAGDRHDVIESNLEMLRAIQPADEPEATFWENVNRRVFEHVVGLLKWVRGDDLTYWDVMEYLEQPERLVPLQVELARRVRYWQGRGLPPGVDRDDIHEAESHIRFVQAEIKDKQRLAKLVEVSLGLRNMVSNLLGNKAFRRCITPPRGPSGGRCISVDQIVTGNSVLLVSTNDAVLRSLSPALGRLVLTLLEQAISRRYRVSGRVPPHMIYVDEAKTYMNNAFGNFLAKAREARCGITLGLQSLSQLDSLGKNFRGVIVANVRNRVIYGGQERSDMAYWIETWGTKTVEQITVSRGTRRTPLPRELASPVAGTSYEVVSHGESVREQEKPLVDYNSLYYLPADQAIVQILRNRNVQPPVFARVSVVEELPPKRRVRAQAPQIDIRLTHPGPVLPEVPPEAYEQENRGQSSRQQPTEEQRGKDRDAGHSANVSGGGNGPSGRTSDPDALDRSGSGPRDTAGVPGESGPRGVPNEPIMHAGVQPERQPTNQQEDRNAKGGAASDQNPGSAEGESERHPQAEDSLPARGVGAESGSPTSGGGEMAPAGIAVDERGQQRLIISRDGSAVMPEPVQVKRRGRKDARAQTEAQAEPGKQL